MKTSTLAYFSSAMVVLLIAGLVSGFIATPNGPYTIAIVTTLFHLAMFPVIAALPAPAWARAAGYAWLAVDLAVNGMELSGVPMPLPMQIRLGAHLPASLFFAASSWKASGAMKPVGILLGITLGAFTFLSQWIPQPAMMPSLLLLVAWLFLVGRALGKHATVSNPSFATE